MSITSIVKEFEKRKVDWRVISSVLRQTDFLPGLGWQNTAEKYQELYKNDPVKLKEFEGLLKVYFEEVLQYEQKSVSFYNLSKSAAKDLYTEIANNSAKYTKNSSFGSTYPFPLSESKLIKLRGSTELTKIYYDNEEVRIVFCSSIVREVKIQLSTSDLDPNAIQNYGLTQGQSIYATKESTEQTYDVICINRSTGTVDLRVDSSIEMPQVARQKRFDSLRSQMILFFNKVLKRSINIDGPVNLFSVVRKMYENVSEGRVCELSFTTETGSSKQEKMRRKNIDLREETYHLGGKLAVQGQIDPYRMAISWIMRKGQKDENEPELLLRGTLKMLSKPTIHLKFVEISKILDSRDYQFIKNRILNYI